ncbi:MAG: 6-carboxytetrahydropterin synthase [Planctomycetaceae bacterium]|nr:6-carboxytetrahydropterin synthase [Planctomycetaceae bacterium]
MHLLSRQIRFAIDPFTDSQQTGSNSYCAKPTAEGLAFFFTLYVELKSNVNKDTGFVVNVAEIDKIVRGKTIGLFNDFVADKCHSRESGNPIQFAKLLTKVWRKIENDFLPAEINSLSLELMPARKITVKERTGDMLYFSEKFEFAASHTLWNTKFSEDENFKLFGKCANKCGHGHNYIVEITIKKQSAGKQIIAGDYERIVDENFISVVDHKNLNADVEYFKKANPTVENIAEFAYKSLEGKFKPAKLDCVTVWENDRTFCCYRNE